MRSNYRPRGLFVSAASRVGRINNTKTFETTSSEHLALFVILEEIGNIS